MEANQQHRFCSPSWVSSNSPAEGSSINFNLFPMEHTKEAMFEKSLTPSDVGKLNRLVIPKQHAEKHFPLGGLGADKGLLLCFEDESGKLWRFRYSYWNSSQSYVLTKGWSRFVKEKLLEAGDIVSFQRLRYDGTRLFIGWRRRAAEDFRTNICNNTTTTPNQAHPLRRYNYHPDHHYNQTPHAAPEPQQLALPTVASPKRMRLFGVNMEWQPNSSLEDEPSAPAFDGFGAGPNHSQSYYDQHLYSQVPSSSYDHYQTM